MAELKTSPYAVDGRSNQHGSRAPMTQTVQATIPEQTDGEADGIAVFIGTVAVTLLLVSLAAVA